MRLKRTAALAMAAVCTMSVVFTGCGNSIDSDAVVATLGDKKITLGQANFMAKYQQASYDSYYLDMFGTDMWSQDLYGSGSTLQEDVKGEIETSLEEMYLLDEHQEDYNVSITEEETAAMETAADTFLENNSDKAIKQVGATKEYIVEMLRLYTIQNKMHDAIIADANIEVTDEEAAQRTFSYVEVSKTTHTDDAGESVDYTDEEKTELATSMQAYAAMAAQDFDGTADTYSYEVKTASYGSAADEDASLDTAVLEAADALTAGGISGLIETDDNYYVIRLDSEYDEEASATKKDSLISSKESEAYQAVLDKYKEDAEWNFDEDVWAAVTFDQLFTMTEETESSDTSGSTE